MQTTAKRYEERQQSTDRSETPRVYKAKQLESRHGCNAQLGTALVSPASHKNIFDLRRFTVAHLQIVAELEAMKTAQNFLMVSFALKPKRQVSFVRQRKKPRSVSNVWHKAEITTSQM